jgi:2-polyprenyl-3-methyl-5-hydroxy-6-metoxy-1,4-benzoquinol methylase
MSNDDQDANWMRDLNKAAWDANRYEAWVTTIGSPLEEAHKLRTDPAHKLRRLLPHLGEVAGQRICNIQGSHARIAVALALLGAEVSVIDFSEENRRYGVELAEHSGVSITYFVSDVIEADTLGLKPFDALVMELGILHYHQDISRFFNVMAAIAAPGARLVLEDFHPVQRKLFNNAAPRDYFNAELVKAEVPGLRFNNSAPEMTTLRFWTLGDIVTAAVQAGFVIEKLLEHPDGAEPAIPGTFSLIARRGSGLG